MSKIIRNFLILILLVIAVLSLLTLNEREFPLIEADLDDSEAVSLLVEEEAVQLQSPYTLSRHFPDKISVKEKVEPVVEDVIPETDNGPVYAGHINYISTVVNDDGTVYYFKDSRIGRLLTAGVKESGLQWIVEVNEYDFYILRNGEELYKVMKK